MLLNFYYHGSGPYRRWCARRAAVEGRVPVVVLFYHRIADDKANPWTASNRMFRRQIDWLQSRFDLISLAEAQERISDGNSRPAVSITFDDGYACNCREAIPLLIKKKIPCTYFVTAGNVLDTRFFDHDLAAGNRFSVNSLEQIRSMAAAGIEIGSHCHEHVDLGAISDPARLRREVITAKDDLEQAIQRPVRYFAFPFGQYVNMSSEAFQMARDAGFEAVCSAYGGYNVAGDDPFHLQRIHVDPGMIRLKNRVTIDPRMARTVRYSPTPIPLPCATSTAECVG